MLDICKDCDANLVSDLDYTLTLCVDCLISREYSCHYENLNRTFQNLSRILDVRLDPFEEAVILLYRSLTQMSCLLKNRGDFPSALSEKRLHIITDCVLLQLSQSNLDFHCEPIKEFFFHFCWTEDA